MFSKSHAYDCNVQFIYEPHIGDASEDFRRKAPGLSDTTGWCYTVTASQRKVTDENLSRRRTKRYDSVDEENQGETVYRTRAQEWRS